MSAVAAVLLAGGASAGDASLLAAMAATAREAGVDPIVAALPRDAAAPPGTRVALVRAGAPPIGALRAGMALLANTAARHVLLWPLGAAADVDTVRALLNAAVREGAAVTALADHDLESSPVVVARDAWLELMTLGEQGIGAVAARRGVHRIGAS